MDEPPPETPTTSITTNLPSTNNTVIPVSKKSSSGLSTGAICGIAIPCIAALLGVAAAAAFVKGGAIASTPAVGALTTPSLPDPKFIDTSLDKFQVIEEMPTPQQIPQPQIIEPPQPVQVQPVQEVVRPSYPVNRVIEPPRVTQSFQNPVIQQPQQVQMVPVQEVQMVPVQEVQMVPVEQVEMVPVQQMAQAPQMQAIPQIQTVPVQQMYQIGQAAEVVPQISTMPSMANAISQAPLGSEVISQVPQMDQALGSEVVSQVPQMGQVLGSEMIQPQVLPTQILPSIDHGVQVLPSQVLGNQGGLTGSSTQGIDFSLNNLI
jgi:hypothetical protein